MGFRQYNKIFFNQLWKDSAIRWFLILLAVTHVPYFFFGQATEATRTYSVFVATVFLMPFTIFVLWPRQPGVVSARETSFWKILSLVFCGWWAVNAMFLFLPGDAWNTYLDVVTDAIFIVYYIGWLSALSLTPHVPGESAPRRSDRMFLMTAPIVLTFGLFFYFVLIPIRLAPEVYESWIPSLLFYTGIDIVLVLVLVALTVRARSTRWRVLYAMLACVHVSYAILDMLEALNYKWVYGWAELAASDVLWTLPFMLLVATARARDYEYPVEETSEESRYKARDILEASISPVIMVSFVLPVLHIALDQFGLLDESMRGAQGAVVLFTLVLFWILAIGENISLRVSTERSRAKLAELDELRVNRAIAEQSEQTKRRFLANISHEIRTPMNGILGMSEILLNTELDDEQRRHAGLLLTSAKELISVVDDILEYSKIQVGELSLKMAPFNLEHLARNVFDLFAATESSGQIEITLDIKDDVPVELEGDASRLRQVLVNLLANAIKFTDKGKVRLEFSVLEKSLIDARIQCRVTDTGIGINTEETDDLFLPFSQGDDTTTRKYGGSGLGLALSKQIVEAHGGTIGAFGNPLKGSTFWFEIPFRLAGAADEFGAEADREVRPEMMGGAGTILLAEDDKINMMVAVKQLESLGFAVDAVENGQEAVEALQHKTYDLLLMDCQMPVLDGLEATRLIRAQGYADLPIVAISANVFDEDRKACFEAGMNDFIAKPFVQESMRAVLARWL
ncbi:MAG: response regulator [Lysobacterales bacterium]|jgi:signal transduction histidine kinase/CheY-like chemotaxis protein